MGVLSKLSKGLVLLLVLAVVRSLVVQRLRMRRYRRQGLTGPTPFPLLGTIPHVLAMGGMNGSIQR